MMNPNMAKWIFASVCKFFSEEVTELSLPFFAEGADDPKSEVYQNTNLSSRVDGPMIVEYSGSTAYRVDIQGLLTEVGKRRPAYKLHDDAGKIAEAMRGGIPVYQIPEAPEQVVGCLLPDPRSVESVRIVNLGDLSVSSKVRQISVVGKFYIED
jgi:hypothetical protein